MAQSEYLCLERGLRPKQPEEPPPDQVEQILHRAFITRFGLHAKRTRFTTATPGTFVGIEHCVRATISRADTQWLKHRMPFTVRSRRRRLVETRRDVVRRPSRRFAIQDGVLLVVPQSVGNAAQEQQLGSPHIKMKCRPILTLAPPFLVPRRQK